MISASGYFTTIDLLGVRMFHYKRFSERMNLVSPRDEIQIESMDDDLRTAIWNCLYLFYLKKLEGYWNNIITSD